MWYNNQTPSFWANGCDLWFPRSLVRSQHGEQPIFAKEREAGGLRWEPGPRPTLSSDTWFPVTGCHLRWARPQDRHRQEDGTWELSQVLATYSTRWPWRPWESRWPSFPRRLGVPRHQDHSCLCSRGVCQLNSCLGRKGPKWGESMRVWKPKLWCRPSKAKPSVKGSEQSDLFQT